MKRKNFIWTDELIDDFKKCWNNESLSSIYTRYKCAPTTLIKKAKELGLDEYKPRKSTFKWTEENINLLKEKWKNESPSDIAKELNCAVITVYEKVKELDLPNYKYYYWTKEEDELLKQYASKYVTKTIAKKLNRDCVSVQRRALKLGIELHSRKDPWKKWMLDYLKDNINKVPISKITEMTGMNYNAIIKKCEELNIEVISNRFTEAEDQFLMENAPKYYIGEVAKKLNRNENTVIRRCKILGINYITKKKKVWLEDEVNYIKENYGVLTIQKMAEELKVSKIMVKSQINRMGLNPLNENYNFKWTEENLNKLRELAKKKDKKQLAKYFNTTEQAILIVAYRNDITLLSKIKHWSLEEDNFLKEYAITMTNKEIADKLNRTQESVRKRIKQLGIQKLNNNSWKSTDDEKLKQLIDDGKDLFEIMEIMRKSDNFLIKKSSELNLNLTIPKTEWTKKEEQMLIEMAKTMKINDISIKLKKKSSAIYTKCKSLGITLNSVNQSWTNEDVELLKRLVDDGLSLVEIADKMNRNQYAIQSKISKLNLSLSKNYTDEEIQILKDMYGNYPIEKIAKTLGRSEIAIRRKIYKMKLGTFAENNYDGISIPDLRILLNVSDSVIKNYYMPMGLKYKKKKISASKEYIYVEINDLLEFLQQNQNIWDSRNLELNILGEEPDWLKEKRVRDKEYGIIDELNIISQKLKQDGKYYIDNDSETQEKDEVLIKQKKGM